MKDMGKVIGVLRGKYAGQMDFGKASEIGKGEARGLERRTRTIVRSFPRKREIQSSDYRSVVLSWVPAFAGTNGLTNPRCPLRQRLRQPRCPIFLPRLVADQVLTNFNRDMDDARALAVHRDRVVGLVGRRCRARYRRTVRFALTRAAMSSSARASAVVAVVRARPACHGRATPP